MTGLSKKSEKVHSSSQLVASSATSLQLYYVRMAYGRYGEHDSTQRQRERSTSTLQLWHVPVFCVP